MRFIICSDKSVVETEGNMLKGKEVLVIKSWLNYRRQRASSLEEEAKMEERDARRIADFLDNLSEPVFLRLTRVMKKRAGKLKREIRERENRIMDITGSQPYVSDYSLRNRERFAGVLGLDKIRSWDDIKRALGLPDYAVIGEMTDALRKRITRELELSEETGWNGIALALGFTKPVPIYEIIEALRKKRALKLELPKTTSWQKIRNKQKAS